jgi:hypothetical protein
MNRWNRRYSWEEWRQNHRDLSDEDALRLYQQESEWFEQFYEELKNLYQNRLKELVKDINVLKEDISEIFAPYTTGSFDPPK